MDCEPGRSGAWTIVVAITDAHVFIKVFPRLLRRHNRSAASPRWRSRGDAEQGLAKALPLFASLPLPTRAASRGIASRDQPQAPRAPFEVAPDTSLARLPFSPATCSDLTSAIRSTTAAYPFGRSASTATPASEPRMSLMRCKIDTAGELRLRKTRADTIRSSDDPHSSSIRSSSWLRLDDTTPGGRSSRKMDVAPAGDLATRASCVR